jgi:methyl-accepting chemotaxis protein
LLERDDTDGVSAPDNLESIRAEFVVVVKERRRRELCRPALVADIADLRRDSSNQIVAHSNQIAALNGIVSGQFAEQSKQISEQSNQIAVLNDIVSGQVSQLAEQTNQIAQQTNQITNLHRSTSTIIEQNQLMHEQMRQMHALLMSREQEPSANVDERDECAVKRRRTNR